MPKNMIRLVLETSIGMLCYVLLLGVPSWLLHSSLSFVLPPILLGLAAGSVSNVLMSIHMAYVTERVTDSMNEAYASKTAMIHTMVRKAVFIIVPVHLGTRPQINPVAITLRALDFKVGAFLQPSAYRAFSRGAVTYRQAEGIF